MLTRDEIVVVGVACFVAGTFPIAYLLESIAIWIAWGVTSVVVSGAVLLRYNWGLDPPGPT